MGVIPRASRDAQRGIIRATPSVVEWSFAGVLKACSFSHHLVAFMQLGFVQYALPEVKKIKWALGAYLYIFSSIILCNKRSFFLHVWQKHQDHRTLTQLSLLGVYANIVILTEANVRWFLVAIIYRFPYNTRKIGLASTYISPVYSMDTNYAISTGISTYTLIDRTTHAQLQLSQYIIITVSASLCSLVVWRTAYTRRLTAKNRVRVVFDGSGR